MNRRDFTKFLALLAAGAAAQPEQIAAFERYYNLNSIGDAGLAAIDEVLITGSASTSLPVWLELWVAGKLELPGLGCNLFGGIMRWSALRDQKIVAPANQVVWHVKSANPDLEVTDDWLKDQFRAHISYIDQEGIRRTVRLRTCQGTLA